MMRALISRRFDGWVSAKCWLAAVAGPSLRWRPRPRSQDRVASARSLALELHVLVGGGVGVVGHQGEARFGHARPVPVEVGQLPDGDDHRLVVDELLDAVEERLALLAVHLARLL